MNCVSVATSRQLPYGAGKMRDRRWNFDALAVVRIRLPAEHRQHDKKTDHIGNGDMPAEAKPQAGVLAFRIHVGESNPGRRAEPDHRSAEAYRIGEHAPVVAALPQ